MRDSPALASAMRHSAFLAEVADVISGLGPVADQLGTRAAIAQYEADIGDPGLTRAGTAYAGTVGPLPRFLPMRDIVRMSFNVYELVSPEAILQRVAGSTRLPVDDHLGTCLPYAPTLRAALALSQRYSNLTLPWFALRLDDMGDSLRIICATLARLGRMETLSVELALFTGYRIVENIVGLQVAGARVHFGFNPVSRPTARFSCPVTCGDGDSYLAIPTSWCDRPNPHHDPGLWAEGLDRCEADIRAVVAAPIVAKVRRHVAQTLDRGKVPKLAETASALCLSRRTMVRMLGQKGTTHRQLVEDDRRRRALRLLGMQHLASGDIADTLGFPDQSSFGRKCKTWFGETPARLRQRLLSGK